MHHRESYPQLLCRLFKEWRADVLQDYLTGWCTTLANFQQAYSLGTGSNGLPAAKISISESVVVVDMHMYGPNLERCPPEDEQVRYMALLSAI